MDLPSGVINYGYAEDMAIFRTKTQWALLILLFIGLFTFPLYCGNWVLSVINIILITIISAHGLNVLTGYCGQISLGQAAFMGIGAYSAAILAKDFNLPFLAAVLCGGLTTGLIGLIFGTPSLRVKGLYLAITTLAAQFIAVWAFTHLHSLTGGTEGLAVPPATIGGLRIIAEGQWFYVLCPFAIAVTFLVKNLARTRTGRAFIAIRDNDLAAEVMGVSVFGYKLQAFFISCFITGVSGALLGYYLMHISPEHFGLMGSIFYLGLITIGGVGTTLGPILGALFMRLLEQGTLHIMPVIGAAFPSATVHLSASAAMIVYGMVIIIFLIFEPRGLAHRWMLFKSAYRLWPFSY